MVEMGIHVIMFGIISLTVLRLGRFTTVLCCLTQVFQVFTAQQTNFLFTFNLLLQLQNSKAKNVDKIDISIGIR